MQNSTGYFGRKVFVVRLYNPVRNPYDAEYVF